VATVHSTVTISDLAIRPIVIATTIAAVAYSAVFAVFAVFALVQTRYRESCGETFL
jgi:hypothetical protein